MILPGYTCKNDTVYKSLFLDWQRLGIKISLFLSYELTLFEILKAVSRDREMIWSLRVLATQENLYLSPHTRLSVSQPPVVSYPEDPGLSPGFY